MQAYVDKGCFPGKNYNHICDLCQRKHGDQNGVRKWMEKEGLGDKLPNDCIPDENGRKHCPFA